MWAAVKLFLRDNWLWFLAKAAIVLGVLGAVAAVYRAGKKAEQNDVMKKDLGYAKEALKQDAAIASNSDVDGMRVRLSKALRRKRDA